MPIDDLPATSLTTDSTETRVALARFETKLDLVIGEHSKTLGDHENRLRVVEAQSVVTPKGLLAALGATVALLGGSVALLDRLYPL